MKHTACQLLSPSSLVPCVSFPTAWPWPCSTKTSTRGLSFKVGWIQEWIQGSSEVTPPGHEHPGHLSVECSWKEHYSWLMGNTSPVLGTKEEFLLKKDPHPWESLAGSRGMFRMGGVGIGMSCRTQWGIPSMHPLPLGSEGAAGDASLVLLLPPEPH